MPVKLDTETLKQHFHNMRLVPKSTADKTLEPRVHMALTSVDEEKTTAAFVAAILDEKNGFSKFLTPEEISGVVGRFLSFHDSELLNIYPPSTPPVVVAQLVALNLKYGCTLYPNDFTKHLVNVAKKTFGDESNEKREVRCMDYDVYDACFIIAVGNSRCDVDALVEVCASTVGDRFYKLKHVFLKESVSDTFLEKLKKKLHNLCGGEQLSTEDLEAIAAAKKYGPRIEAIGELVIVEGTMADNLPMRNLTTLNVVRYRNDAELLKLVGEIPQHLCCATLWGDVVQNQNIAARLPCSTVWINTFGDTSISTPLCRHPLANVHVKKQTGGNVVVKLLNVPELQQYREIMLEWLTLDTTPTPRDTNVRINTLGPYGKVYINWPENDDDVMKAVRVCIGALACGNQVIFSHFGSSKTPFALVEALTKVIPSDYCKIDRTGYRDNYSFAINLDRDGPLTRAPNDGWKDGRCYSKEHLIECFLKFQYVWLPKIGNL